MAYGDMFRRLLRERGITHLVHFTQLENLPSIIDSGIRPRAELDAEAAPYLWSDPWRLDGFPDSVSLSITDPNYAMLNSLQKRMPRSRWIVLGIDPEILIGAQCRFCARNAASSFYKNSWRSFRNLAAFEEMFEDQKRWDGSWEREARQLQDCQTTDPQAEILFFGTIPPDRIIFGTAEDTVVGQWVQDHLDRIGGWERDVHLGPLLE